MPKDNNDFDSLFEDEPKPKGQDQESELFDFDEVENHKAAEEPPPVTEESPDASLQGKKRTSNDFEPDMDALLISAQSSMIIEGMKYLTHKEFSAGTYQIYTEAIKGVDLYIKILERNPNNYNKLSEMINRDIDCKEVERIAFQLFKTLQKEMPQTDSQKLQAYEILRRKLQNGYYKALISSSIVGIKKYFLLSGGLDEEKITQLVMKNNPALKTDVAKLTQHIKMAIQLLKSGDYEITKGLKGRDVNNFIIKSTQLLAYFYLVAGNQQAQKYYRKMHENYKKYFIVR